MATRLQKRTAELMLKKLENKLNGLYQQQESSKTPKQKTKGLQKMSGGGPFEDPNWKDPSLNMESWMTDPKGWGTMTDQYNMGSASNLLTSNAVQDIIPGPGSDTGLMSTPMVGGASNTGFENFIGNTDWANAGLSALSTAPILYNLFQGSQEEQRLNPRDFYNPYENEIRSTMRNRRFNVDPILQSNLAAQQTYNQNIRNSGALGSGALRSNYLAGSAQRQLADAGAYAQKSNVDNQYLGQQAQMDAQLGSQKAQTRLGVQDMNDRNSAARRGMLGQGFADMSNWAQTQQLMRNQKSREPMYADVSNTYSPYSQNYFPTFFNNLKRKSVNR